MYSKSQESGDGSTHTMWASEDGRQIAVDMIFVDHMSLEVGSDYNDKHMTILHDAYYNYANADDMNKFSTRMVILYEKLRQDMLTHSELWGLFWEII
jgi:biotin-(acetyl-CoA carboxylase) ligase